MTLSIKNEGGSNAAYTMKWFPMERAVDTGKSTESLLINSYDPISLSNQYPAQPY